MQNLLNFYIQYNISYYSHNKVMLLYNLLNKTLLIHQTKSWKGLHNKIVAVVHMDQKGIEEHQD